MSLVEMTQAEIDLIAGLTEALRIFGEDMEAQRKALRESREPGDRWVSGVVPEEFLP